MSATAAEQVAPVAADQSACEAIAYGRWCGQPSAGATTMGCVHEHVGTARICEDCRRAMLALMKSGDFTCDPCRDIDGHHCHLTELRYEVAR